MTSSLIGAPNAPHPVAYDEHRRPFRPQKLHHHLQLLDGAGRTTAAGRLSQMSGLRPAATARRSCQAPPAPARRIRLRRSLRARRRYLSRSSPNPLFGPGLYGREPGRSRHELGQLYDLELFTMLTALSRKARTHHGHASQAPRLPSTPLPRSSPARSRTRTPG